MTNQAYLPGLIPLSILYSQQFTSWLRQFMNSGALPLGPAHLLRQPGDYFVSPFTNGDIVVIRGNDGIDRAFFNVCPHRRKNLFPIPSEWTLGSFTGNQRSDIVCPGHSWTFSLKGKKGEHSPGCQGLDRRGGIANIGGQLWVGGDDELRRVEEILKLPLAKKYGISHLIHPTYRLHKVLVFREAYRPFTGLKVYGDVDHVDDRCHEETLKRVASVEGLEIDISSSSESVSLQVVSWLPSCDPAKTSLTWRRYHEEVAKLHAESPEANDGYIAWFQESRSGDTIEQFPRMVVESRFAPDPTGQGTLNIVGFYFDEEVLAFRDAENDTDEFGDVVHWAMKAYADLAPEDAQLCLDEDRGCETLVMHGYGNKTDGMYGDHQEGVSYQYECWLRDAWEAHQKEAGPSDIRIDLNQAAQ